MIHQNAYLTQWLKKLQALFSTEFEELITGNAKEILSLKYYQSFNNLYLSDAEYIIANKKEMVEEPNNFSLVYTSNSWLLFKKNP